MQIHSSREIAEAMIQRAESECGANIWHSLFAPVTALSHEPTDHPGYEDVILTRECDRTEEIASAPLAVAWLNAQHGLVQS